ncbi:hypothetical protein PV08_06582 [Exophiala spinifera]|uniref:Xylanolytic transcriptional activator regulatory domain-containing protein n=1 Tax=Exophiala spinifera TaxID=91928 RepID=A0A0D1ZUZ9_9EURO|nr:uncharacterized protein PV08_06582 [Exophiala spinifera]KIW16527.1 hypothetical protein PV08_06582 [Exophiala spinifera]
MLEDRVGTLEARLSSVEPSQLQYLEDLNDDAPPQSRFDNHPRTTRPQQTTTSPPSNSLTLGLGVLSSVAAAEPHYFGSSSGLSLAHFVQTAIDSGPNIGSQVALPLLADRPFSNHAPSSQTLPASLPTAKSGCVFIKAYFTSVHPLYPFLDRKAVWEMHERHTREHQTRSDGSPLDLAVLHLVYAIGSRCLELLGSSKVSRHTPQSHFLAALRYVPEEIKWTSLRSIEITLLLGIHSMRSPSGTSVWHLCGLALRQCLELGLHKQRAVPDHQLLQDQKRKRLFWSTLIFERKTALVLGRPFAVSDKEIDADLPLDVNDGEDDATALAAARRRPPAADDNPAAPLSNMSLHRHHIQLYRIHTKIRFTLHALKHSQQPERLREKIALRFRELEGWRAGVLDQYSNTPLDLNVGVDSLPASEANDSSDSDAERTHRARRTVEIEKTELLLEYNKAQRSLFQPLMTEGQSHYTFGASEYAACAEASGQICQLYRRLHRLSPTPFTLRDLHAVFVAGFTLIYCICNRPSLYNAQHAGDIGACSTVLYVISEQWTSAKKYRDAFEIVSERMIERKRNVVEAGLIQGKNAEVGDGSQSRRSRVTKPVMGGRDRSSARRGVGRISQDSDTPRNQLTGNTPSSTTPCDVGVDDHSVFGSYTDLQDITNLTEADNANADFDPGTLNEFSFGLDLDSDLDDIGGLLTNEGLEWFTGAVL